jgi:general secretion pathway protein I
MAARAQAGFTLIEVVVAFLLLSMVLMTGFEIFTTGLRRAGDLEDQSRALLIAQSRLAAAGTEELFKEGQLQGESDDRRFRWVRIITRSDEGTGEPGKPPTGAFQLFRVEVKVEWRGGDLREHSLMLSTLGLGSRI